MLLTITSTHTPAADSETSVRGHVRPEGVVMTPPVAVRALLFHLYPSIGRHSGQVKTTIIAWETQQSRRDNAGSGRH
jgi:hypothetical protein